MIIGLAGYAGAGKDTVGKILNLCYGYRRVAFADKVKQLALLIDPAVTINRTSNPERYSLATLFHKEGMNWDKIKHHYEVRRTLQDIGQGARDVLGDRVWLNAANLEDHEVEDITVTDVRYLNECREIQSYGGQVWWIQRDGVGPANSHKSETSITADMVNRSLSNNGTLQRLVCDVAALMKYLKRGGNPNDLPV